MHVRGFTRDASSGLAPDRRGTYAGVVDKIPYLKQLGITKLRPGPSGRADAGDPNAANYDPTRANPYPDWPDALTLKDGRQVASAEMWWRASPAR